MKIINTGGLAPDDVGPWEREQIYNGLDVCVTLEVLEAILPQLDNHTGATYNFSRALQGPALEMKLRGVKVDNARKAYVLDAYHDQLDKLQQNLDRIVIEGVGMDDFDWRSNKSLASLFYDYLGIPTITRGGRPTVDRNALEKMEAYYVARPIVAFVKAMRDIGKKITVLKTAIDPDGRMRTSYNIAGTSTGRFSSSFTEFGTGGNLQNVEELLRSIFVSDVGMKFAKFDAKSGESYCVGGIEWNLFQDGRYLDACESGDPHTAAARVCWPKLAWTGLLKRDKEIAEQPYYRHHTYRFMCKKLGHGSNYGGQATTLSTEAKVPIEVVRDFQPKYFSAYPAHLQWHAWVKNELWTVGHLISLSGRKRWFFGRRNEDKTLREAIAYDPQCSLADIVNGAMLRIWNENIATVMFQDHDALTFQYPEDQEDEIVPKLHSLLPKALPLLHNRDMTIPYDCKTGWNKGDFNAKTNPDGLKDFFDHDKRSRSAQIGILDRPVRRRYG